MRNIVLAATVSTLALTNTALADAPSVAVDIAPVYSLVAQVMEGVGTPNLIVQQGASPHGYSLRPAEAKALEDADIVFWVGEGLEPWLERSIDSLAADAKSVELAETEGTTELEFREGATFEKHSHDHGDEDHDHDHEAHEDHDDHDHDAHADHDDDDHDEHEAHEDHDEDHDHAGHEDHDEDHEHEEAHEEHEHDHHGHDPHAWLDPKNASVWLDVIAADLSELDPDNASTYAANAAKGKADLEKLTSMIKTELESIKGKNFVVFHDAYHYFENRFGISAAGSIRLGDASDPSPARIAEIRDKVAELQISCAFSEPQFNAGLLETVFEGTDAKVGVLDPLGSDLTLGPDLYSQLLRNLSKNLTSCM